MAPQQDHVLGDRADRRTPFDGVFNTVKTILVSTPDVTRLPQVQEITARCREHPRHRLRARVHRGGRPDHGRRRRRTVRYTAKTLMPRLIVAFVAAHFSPLFCSQIISVADAMTTALAGSDPTTARVDRDRVRRSTTPTTVNRGAAVRRARRDHVFPARRGRVLLHHPPRRPGHPRHHRTARRGLSCPAAAGTGRQAVVAVADRLPADPAAADPHVAGRGVDPAEPGVRRARCWACPAAACST